MKQLGVFLIWLSISAQAFETGVLNVFTDLPKALIKVDGVIVATESVVKLPLQVGEHYVQVELNDSLVYAKKVLIKPNRTTTVVSEHFVDIITKTPSRGAIDREAERLRKSRGNIAFGVLSSNILQREMVSIKWWAHKHYGVHALAGGRREGSNEHGIIGGRFFISPADKIYEDQVLSGNVFFGGGQKTYENSHSTSELNPSIVSESYMEFGINIEAYIGQLVKEFMMNRYQYGPTFSRKRKVTYSKDKKERTVEESQGWGTMMW